MLRIMIDVSCKPYFLQVTQAAGKLAKKVESLDLRESNPKSARAVLSSIQ